MFPKLAPILDYLNSLTSRSSLTHLHRMLMESDVTPHDLAAACKFDQLHYSRNKMACSDWYDCYLMCWRPGQTTAIHDHAGSSCAFKILEGTATETACLLTDSEKRLVRECKQTQLGVGQVCVAQDLEIHKISNASESANLITLHIYSPPLKMGVYEVDPSEPASAHP